MDSQTFTSLTNKVRDGHKATQERLRELSDFLQKLEDHINVLAGQTYKVCSWGEVDSTGEFVKHEYAGGISHFTFALKISFFDEKQHEIASLAIDLVADWEEDSIRVAHGDKTVSVPVNRCFGEQALTEIATLIDRPLKDFVEGPSWNDDDYI